MTRRDQLVLPLGIKMSPDQRKLLDRLREVKVLERTQIGSRPISRAEVKRLMRPLPPITVPR